MRQEDVTLHKIVGGGQCLATLSDGKRVFVWGGLPGETVRIQLHKQRASYAEAVVVDVLNASPQRVAARDPDSYLSTSPWQIMSFEAEQQSKADLIQEAFKLHHITLSSSQMYSDEQIYGYRNKVEFSWWWDLDRAELDLAFFKRGSKGKLPVSGTSLARNEINHTAIAIRDLLRQKPIEGRALKTLLLRTDQHGQVVWQLYVKDRLPNLFTSDETAQLPAKGGEVIYSDPRSPASRITERLATFGDTTLSDTVLQTDFRYAAESFFQVNIPVYERALQDMQAYVLPGPTVDLYSGVGSIGLTIAPSTLTLVEINDEAYQEMRRNITALGREQTAQAVLAASEQALEYIKSDATIIVDPPRAGLHAAVIQRLIEEKPGRIIYLSCNPVTQARDYALLQKDYRIAGQAGYNFFPRTPHIEHLLVLDRR